MNSKREDREVYLKERMASLRSSIETSDVKIENCTFQIDQSDICLTHNIGHNFVLSIVMPEDVKPNEINNIIEKIKGVLTNPMDH